MERRTYTAREDDGDTTEAAAGYIFHELWEGWEVQLDCCGLVTRAEIDQLDDLLHLLRHRSEDIGRRLFCQVDPDEKTVTLRLRWPLPEVA